MYCLGWALPIVFLLPSLHRSSLCGSRAYFLGSRGLYTGSDTCWWTWPWHWWAWAYPLPSPVLLCPNLPFW